MGETRRRQSTPVPAVRVTLGDMIAEGHRDPIAVTRIATLLAKDWCDQWGGWDKCDTPERISQIWAHRPAARKLLCTLAGAV